jgi:hypothetical protein
MRLSLIVSVLTVLAFAGLAAAPASAEIGRTTSRQYPDCQCQFGFDGGCMPKVSCATTGGHCTKGCVAHSMIKSDER